MPRCPRGLKVHFPRLLLALLFQVVYSTEQMPDEVDTFWRECQEEGGLPTSPSRCSIPVLPALPWPWAWSQGCQRDLGFALHTGL